jgi:hypothetical protein
MKATILFVIIAAVMVSCNNTPNKTASTETALPIQGTWQLLKGTLIQKKDTTVTDYTKNQKFIKIINGDHFSFLLHDLTKGKGTAPVFSAGGGSYTLVGDQYTENLEFCNDREFENNKFTFTITIKGDTLVQKGIEKVDSLKLNRYNTEEYIRIK